jgi:CheY-like chemotaxis protein
VDDEVDSLNLLTSALEAAGAKVVTFSSGADALAGIRERRPDVVIADIGMPGMDGLQFIRLMRQLEGPAARTPGRGAHRLRAIAGSRDVTRGRASRCISSNPSTRSELVIAVATLADRRQP